MPSKGQAAVLLPILATLASCLVLSFIGGCDSSQPTAVDKSAGAPERTKASERKEQSNRAQPSVLSPEQVLRAELIANPQSPQTLFRLAGILADQKKFTESLELLEGIPPDDPQLGLPSLGFAGDLYFATAQFKLAKRKYEAVLERAPNAAPALRHLALILNRQGLRHQAAVHIRTLCQLGDVRQDELQALLSVPDAIRAERPTSGEPVSEFSGYYPIGSFANARWEFSKHSYEEARKLLAQLPTDQSATAAEKAFFARLLASTQRMDEAGNWLAAGKDSLKEEAEFWSAAGVYLIEQKRFEQSIRANAESLVRDPSDVRVYFRLQQALAAIGELEQADKFWMRYLSLRKSIDLGLEIKKQPIPTTESLMSLAENLEKLDRNLEALMWRAIALHRVDTSNDMRAELKKNQQLAELNEQRKKLVERNRCFASPSQILCGLKLDRYPLPDWDAMKSDSSPSQSTSPQSRLTQDNESLSNSLPIVPRFSDLAAKVGLNHQYRVAAKPQPEQFAIYQSMGGGVGVLDYDLNGQPDLFMAQGGCDPPDFVSNSSNQLFRQQDGQVMDATSVARCVEHRYTLGVTAGDWNQDGYPDLAYATFRGPVLLINNADGTFQSHPVELPKGSIIMSTSLAIADVNGDGLSDLVQVNYSDDPTLVRKADRKDDGTIEQLSPLTFRPTNDWIVFGTANGQCKGEVLQTEKAAGLGVLISDFDSQPGNEVIIANDIYPDNFLKFSLDQRVSDSAMVRGCALGGRGTRTASMGIASADFDRNGDPDFLVTNFEDDTNSLFLNKGGDYVERSVLYGLDQVSWPLVGFGCQSVDYDLNGSADLVVLNGRVDQPADGKHDFHQPTQVVANLNDRMKLMTVEDPSGYFSRNHLGRGLAKLDFNGDGRTDLVATHLEEPSALLINQTSTNHHWIRFQLVGTTSERDATGSKIQIQYADESASAWVTAGDGYMAKNESGIAFGLGNNTQVQGVLVVWPNGQRQEFGKLNADRSWIIVQDIDTVFESVR